MMISCNVIKDLLPLYAENMVSEDSKKLVEAHLAECSDCQSALDALIKPVQIAQEADVSALERVEKQISRRKGATAWFAVMLTATLVCAIWGGLFSPMYLSAEDAIIGVSVTDYVDRGNIVTVEYGAKVDSLLFYVFEDENTGRSAQAIMAYTTRMDWLLGSRDAEARSITFPADMDIWYRELGALGKDTLLFSQEAEPVAEKIPDDPLLLPALAVGALFAVVSVLLRKSKVWKVTAVFAVIGFSAVLSDLLLTSGSWVAVKWGILVVPILTILLTGTAVCAYRLMKVRKETA